jgi:small subunit ribosomal protein S1
MIDNTGKFDEEISMEHVANSAVDVTAPNRILKGEIVTVDNEFAYVNVGSKSEGRVSLEEFAEKPKVGDVISVMLVSRRPIDGMFVFSKNAAERHLKWQNFIEWYRQGNRYISGAINDVSDRGLDIDCDGISGFLPYSQAGDLKFKKSSKTGEAFTFKIRKVDEGKNKIILSRKDYTDEENEKIWAGFREKYSAGSRASGRLLRYAGDGAIVNIDGVEAYMKKEDMSWKKVFKKRNVLKMGDEREFQVLEIDDTARRVTVGIKQLAEDPWLSAGERYPAGAEIQGRVVTVTNFGVFVEVEDGVEGLVAASEISWTRKSLNPAELYKKGDRVSVKVLSIDPEERKMSLGIKQLTPNPWDTIHERFPGGTVVKKPIKKIVNFGMFVELEDDIDGLIHISDVSWDDDARDVLKNYREGDEVEFKILEVRADQQKVACGIKHLTRSPWEALKEKYPARSKVSGVVTRITNFGLFVKIEDGIEGLVHISEVSRKKIETLEERFTIGDRVSAVVLGVDPDKKRMSLSIKHFEMQQEKEELSRVLAGSNPTKVTFGDILKDKL